MSENSKMCRCGHSESNHSGFSFLADPGVCGKYECNCQRFDLAENPQPNSCKEETDRGFLQNPASEQVRLLKDRYGCTGYTFDPKVLENITCDDAFKAGRQCGKTNLNIAFIQCLKAQEYKEADRYTELSRKEIVEAIKKEELEKIGNKDMYAKLASEMFSTLKSKDNERLNGTQGKPDEYITLAMNIFNKSYDDVTEMERRKVKAVINCTGVFMADRWKNRGDLYKNDEESLKIYKYLYESKGEIK